MAQISNYRGINRSSLKLISIHLEAFHGVSGVAGLILEEGGGIISHHQMKPEVISRKYSDDMKQD